MHYFFEPTCAQTYVQVQFISLPLGAVLFNKKLTLRPSKHVVHFLTMQCCLIRNLPQNQANALFISLLLGLVLFDKKFTLGPSKYTVHFRNSISLSAVLFNEKLTPGPSKGTVHFLTIGCGGDDLWGNLDLRFCSVFKPVFFD